MDRWLLPALLLGIAYLLFQILGQLERIGNTLDEWREAALPESDPDDPNE